MIRQVCLSLFVLLAPGLGCGPGLMHAQAAAGGGASPDFTREVRPILSRHCFKCHGPDEATRKARLRLDVRESAVQPAKSGAVAVVPGRAEESELVKRIFTADEDEVMPPPSTKVVMSAGEKDVLRRWVASGAEYRQHWAFVPPVQKPLPGVRRTDWPRNPVDYFILSRLEKEGLEPAAAADRYTLVRRVFLDLIGLPPTPSEADAFVSDPAPNAYERLVDRLLASPHYGERWGRRWMDLARYADSNGYEKDRTRSIWPWRDWVVRALNADMPFDRFTIEQLAGDMLPGATVDQRIATGFHRNTMLNEEGGIDPLEFRFHAMTDRVSTTGTAWLGLTVGCAQCHTHKYDPIPHTEYFQMMAFLDNADEPDMDMPDPDLDRREKLNREKAAQLLAGLADQFPVGSSTWRVEKPVRVTSIRGEEPRVLEDGSVLFSGKAPETDTYTVEIETGPGSVDSMRLEAMVDDALPSRGPGRVAHGNFVLTNIRITAYPRGGDGTGTAKGTPVTIVSGKADVEQGGFPVTGAFDADPATGWAVDGAGGKLNASHEAVFTFARSVGFEGGTRFVVVLEQNHGSQHLLGRFRLGLGAETAEATPLAERRRAVVEARFAAWLERERQRSVEWTTLRPVEAKSNMPLLTVQADDSVFGSGDITKSDTYELRFAPLAREVTALRLEAMPDERLPRHGPGMAYYEGPKGDFFMGEFQVLADGRPVRFSRASESFGKNGFGSTATAALAIDGDPQTGWSTSGREGERHEAVFVFADPIRPGARLEVRMLFGRHYACSLGRFRISATSQAGGAEARDLPEEEVALLRVPEARWTPEQRRVLKDRFLLSAPELAGARKEIEALRKPLARTTTLVLRERPAENPRPTFLRKRGEYLQPAERVEPGVLSAVAPFPLDQPRNRLGFARWLVSPSNPLTARVTVNRQWQALFARGLVKTTEDFGFQGESPSHPELLDWLAVEFVRQGWSMKKLHKLLVMSATYQQSSRVTPELLARDSENRLLARGPSVRLEAEIIRDLALRGSGLLSAKLGGASVYPPQPAGVTEVAYGSPGWPTSQGEDRYRRSIYTFAKRTAPFAMFNTFDAPTGEACLARRDVSNTPLQALTLLNDVFFVEVSQAVGRASAAGGGTVESRVRDLFRRFVTRPPTVEETGLLARFYEKQRERFSGRMEDARRFCGEGPGDVVERAAWTAVARAILNLDETITKG